MNAGHREAGQTVAEYLHNVSSLARLGMEGECSRGWRRAWERSTCQPGKESYLIQSQVVTRQQVLCQGLGDGQESMWEKEQKCLDVTVGG